MSVTYVGESAPGVDIQEAVSSRATLKDVVAAYVGLTKPRVIELLLLTTVPVMFFAARGVPGLGLVVATVIGGTLSAGSASVFNCVYDRDIDEQMRRTRRRALPRHIVSPGAALVFGVVLGVVSTVVLAVWVNPLSAVLSVSANAFYVFVYTMLLKRRTTQNIVWGGIAGCFPALIGWTAVTDHLDWAPVALFLVVFFWTPPHTWALALRYREDYANVDVPMLPVVKSARNVAIQIVLYSWVMVAVSLSLRENTFVNPGASARGLAAFLSPGREAEMAFALGQKVGLRPNDQSLAIEALSGGNQQKVVVGRWLATGRKLLIAEDPTAGVDVGAKADIYRLIAAAVEEGLAVLVISTDFEEIAHICHRALVFSRGRIVRELSGADLTTSAVISAASASEAA